MNIGNFTYFKWAAIPDADWESHIEPDLEVRVKQVPTEKTFWGHKLPPPGALIRFIPISTKEAWAADGPSPPVVVLEWNELVHKDLLEPDHDVAEGFGCEVAAKILYGGQMQWVFVKFSMFSIEVLNK
jgi:hypothetical protein